MSLLSKVLEKSRTLTTPEMIGEAIGRAQRAAKRTYRYATDQPASAYLTSAQLRRALAKSSPDEVLERMRSPGFPHLTPGLSDPASTASVLKNRNRESAESIVREASSIVEHKIVLFSRVFQLGADLDWHADPAAGVSWPLLHYTRVPIRIGQGADIRVLWELNRLHHLVTLGQAYVISGDERFTEEFLVQISSWYQQNPPRFGANWTVAMEVAIRAINIVAAMQLFRDSPLIEGDGIEMILKLLICHGRFIRSNIEFSYYVTSNHYLSDLVGLFVLGTSFPQIAEARSWASFSAGELIREMNRQVLPDGCDYEASTGYHRFVLEIFLCFFVLARQAGIDLPGESRDRLESMFDFVRHYLKTDGSAPTIGDSDDGRLMKFKNRPAIDQSYLMSIAAIFFGDGTYKRSEKIDDEAIWWFGADGATLHDGLQAGLKEPVSKAYPDSQIAIQRSGEFYLVADCGDHGAKGRGSHAHSDALSFELFAYGRTLLRDPGTFVYTASELWRNRFRSTAYHNTVQVDGQEISQITEGRLFALGPNVRPRINRWDSSTERDILDAEHSAYVRLDQPVIHRRIIQFHKRKGYWLIGDEFRAPDGAGRGPHLFEFFFNFDSDIEVTLLEDCTAVGTCEEAGLTIVPLSGHGFEARVTNRWVSMSYGTRKPCFGIMYRLYAGVLLRSTVLLVPYRTGEGSKVRSIIEEVNEAGSLYDSPVD